MAGTSNMKFQPNDRVTFEGGGTKKNILGTIVGHGVLMNDEKLRIAYFVHLDEEFQGFHGETGNYISVMAVDQESIEALACSWCHGVVASVKNRNGRLLCDNCFDGGY